MRRAAAACLLAVVACGAAAQTPDAPAPAGSPPPDLAFGAYQRGNFLTALNEALKRLETNPNDAPAMTLLGVIYADGQATRRDPVEAARWFALAADRGDRQAQFSLALAYLRGAGVAESRAKAREWFLKAAAQNHAGALYNLGLMALDDEVQDFRAAADYFARGAAAGDLDAAYGLAVLYKEGSGVPKDRARAAEYFRQAAQEKHVAAMVEYAIALFNGDGAPKDEAGAAKYFARAAAMNSPVAQNRLARLYAVGRGVKADMVEAMKWHTLATANGLKDEWLDAKMPSLTQAEKAAVEEAVQRFVGK